MLPSIVFNQLHGSAIHKDINMKMTIGMALSITQRKKPKDKFLVFRICNELVKDGYSTHKACIEALYITNIIKKQTYERLIND